MSQVVLVLDTETTGTDVQNDQVVELSMMDGIKKDAPCWTVRIKPHVAISPEAQAKHGISMEDLAGCESFSAYAGKVKAKLEAADVLVGYNLRKFDLPLLQAELCRAGVGEAELSGKHLVDVYCLWQNCEPRTLESAHKRFVGGDLDGAHSAEADTRATAAVLKGMARAFKVEETWNGLAKASATNWIGASNHFQWQAGVAVVGFGKHRGKPLEVLAETEPGYLDFIIGRDFPKHVVAICERMVKLSADGRLTRERLTAWLVEEFGAAPSEE